MIRIILESPYAGDVERNLDYAKLCLKDSLSRGESPLVSHLLYTQVLDDDVPQERKLGIDAGLAWKEVADKHVFYTDLGMSPGMEYALAHCDDRSIPIEVRTLNQRSCNKFII